MAKTKPTWAGSERLRALLTPTDSLTLDPENTRDHGERSIDGITASLRKFGQRKPIVVDGAGKVVAGNGTLAAARRLGWTHIATTDVDGMTTDEARAFALVDNRTAELSTWNNERLAIELPALALSLPDLDLGWTAKELRQIDVKGHTRNIGNADDVPEAPATPRTKPGDVWLCGRHRVMCGDSTSAEDVARLMAGAKADMCFTSPPYGQQREYTEESKAKGPDWDGMMRGVFANIPMADSGQVLVNLGLIHEDSEWTPYWDGWIEWMRQQGWRRFGFYVWDQGAGMPGRQNGRLSASHEFVFHFNRSSRGPEKTVENKHAGMPLRPGGQRHADGHVREKTGVGNPIQSHRVADSVIRIERNHGAVDHPAVFPVALPAFVMQSWPGLTYEPFCGSGSSIIAAEQVGCQCFGMEIAPVYVDVAVRRWEAFTGQTATLAQSP